MIESALNHVSFDTFVWVINVGAFRIIWVTIQITYIVLITHKTHVAKCTLLIIGGRGAKCTLS